MYYAFAVQVLESQHYLSRVKLCGILIKSTDFLQVLQQLPSFGETEAKVCGGVAKETTEA